MNEIFFVVWLSLRVDVSRQFFLYECNYLFVSFTFIFYKYIFIFARECLCVLKENKRTKYSYFSRSGQRRDFIFFENFNKLTINRVKCRYYIKKKKQNNRKDCVRECLCAARCFCGQHSRDRDAIGFA